MRHVSMFALVLVAVFGSSLAFAGGGEPTLADLYKMQVKQEQKITMLQQKVNVLQKQVDVLKGQIAQLPTKSELAAMATNLVKQIVGLQSMGTNLVNQIVGIKSQMQAQQNAVQPIMDYVAKFMSVVQIAADTGPSGLDRVTFDGPVTFAYPSVVVALSGSKSPPYATSLQDWYFSSNWNLMGIKQTVEDLQKQTLDNGLAMMFLKKLMIFVEIKDPSETASGTQEFTIKTSVKVFGDLYAASLEANVATIYKELKVWTSFFTNAPVDFEKFFGDFQALLAGEEPTTYGSVKTDKCEMVHCTGQPGICNTISIGLGQSLVDMVTGQAVFTCVKGSMTAQFIWPETNPCLDGLKIGWSAYTASLLPMGSLTDKTSGDTLLSCQ